MLKPNALPRIRTSVIARTSEPCAEQGDSDGRVCSSSLVTPIRLLWLILPAPFRWARFEWRMLVEQNRGPFLGPPELWHVGPVERCGARSCDPDIPGFPAAVCSLPRGHTGMHREEGVCSFSRRTDQLQIEKASC